MNPNGLSTDQLVELIDLHRDFDWQQETEAATLTYSTLVAYGDPNVEGGLAYGTFN